MVAAPLMETIDRKNTDDTRIVEPSFRLELASLLESFKLTHYSIDEDQGRVKDLVLYFEIGLEISIFSKIIDLEEWDDISTLDISLAASSESSRDQFAVPDKWNSVAFTEWLSVESRTYNDNLIACTSGLRLKNGFEESLIVLPSQDTGFLAIKSKFTDFKFDPEFEFTSYFVRNSKMS